MRDIAFLALCAILVLTTHASALSCQRPDAVRSYLRADADTAHWGAVIGRLDFDEGRLPRTNWDRQQDTPPRTEIRAQLVGQSLGPDGWVRPFQQNVTLRVQCFGPWCAAPQSGQRYLAFVKREDAQQVVIADPCGSWLFPAPSRQVRLRLHRCFNGGRCRPEQEQ